MAALFSVLRSRRGLMLENLALRQQLSTVLQKRRIGPVDRAFRAPSSFFTILQHAPHRVLRP